MTAAGELKQVRHCSLCRSGMGWNGWIDDEKSIRVSFWLASLVVGLYERGSFVRLVLAAAMTWDSLLAVEQECRRHRECSQSRRRPGWRWPWMLSSSDELGLAQPHGSFTGSHAPSSSPFKHLPPSAKTLVAEGVVAWATYRSLARRYTKSRYLE